MVWCCGLLLLGLVCCGVSVAWCGCVVGLGAWGGGACVCCDAVLRGMVCCVLCGGGAVWCGVV